MSQWWQSLGDPARIFWGIAIASSLLQVLMFVLSFFAGHDFDHAPDGSVGDSVEGLKLLSVRAIVAFLVGFGWTGGLMLGKAMPVATAVATALLVGAVFMLVIFFIMRMLMSLRADGTLDYQNAIGQTGHVYVTIPAAGRGEGQIEILLQGRLITAHAVTTAYKPLAPQTPVTVTAVENGNLLVVTPAY